MCQTLLKWPSERLGRVHGKTKNKIWLSVYTRTQTLRFPPQFHSQIHAQLKHFCQYIHTRSKLCFQFEVNSKRFSSLYNTYSARVQITRKCLCMASHGHQNSVTNLLSSFPKYPNSPEETYGLDKKTLFRNTKLTFWVNRITYSFVLRK